MKKIVNQNNSSTEQDRFVYYDKLHFIPVEEKNEVWGAQVLAYLKANSVAFIDEAVVRAARKKDSGEIEASEYKKMIDPIMTDGKGNQTGGKAEYFHADWKSCPIYVHLDNILESKIEQIPLNLEVNASDKFAMSKRQKENVKIIGRDKMRSFINEFCKKLDMPPLTKFDDPFKWIEQVKSGQVPEQKTKNHRVSSKLVKQPPANILQSLKDSIDDQESLALFNSVDKLGPEAACELGIKYYLLVANRFVAKARKAVRDIKNHNAHLWRFYTSETTGRPVIEYKEPGSVRTLPFLQEDLSDLKGWHDEDYVTFGDFMQMCGAKLTPDQLREVFEMHRKEQGGGTYPSYEACSVQQRNNAKIKLGYAEFETQDMELYISYNYLGNDKYRKVPTDYKVQKSFKNVERHEKHYNVWYKFYYLPLFLDKVTPNHNLAEQSKYIYRFGKLQDQQREGDDFRYGKSSLGGSMIRGKMSWADIIHRFMPKINYLWFKFQNEMVNAMPNGGLFAKKMVELMAAVADDAQNDSATSGIEFIRKLKQTGWGVADFLTDQDGKMIGDGNPFREFKNTMLADAFTNLDGMMTLYNMMMQALSQNSITEGAGSKPRQNATGIEYSVNASSHAQYFIEKQYQDGVLSLAEKLIYYFKEIIDSGDSERLEDFMSIVGEGLGMSFQTLKDIPYHNLGLSVSNTMSDDQRQLVNGLAEKMASAGILMPEDLFFIADTDNVKYAYAILALKAKKGRQMQAEQQAQQQQQALQMKQMDIQIEMKKIEAMGMQARMNINVEKQWDFKIDQMMNQLKGQLQMEIKRQTGANKTDEMITQSNIEKLNQTGEHAPKEEKAA